MVDDALMAKIQAEGDEVTFKSNGLTCYVQRHRRPPSVHDRSPEMLHLCGYVGVSKRHKWYGKHYDSVARRIRVHGGLTFSGEQSKFKDKWFFGFDCAHLGDLIPGMTLRMNETYRDMEYVKAECRSLAKQLKKVKK